jgi:RNA polymerase sigma-70 factor, ECF subfamily
MSVSGEPAAALAAELSAAGAASPAALDEPAFRELYARTAAPLKAYLARGLGARGGRSEADDLLQESYVRFLTARSVPEGDEDRRRYLFAIGTNLLRDHFRRHRPAEELAEERPAAGNPGRDSRLRLEVGQVLDRLKPKERALLWLAHVEGFDHKEIARIFGGSPAGVRVLLFRARRRLAKLLEERGLGSELLS